MWLCKFQQQQEVEAAAAAAVTGSKASKVLLEGTGLEGTRSGQELSSVTAAWRAARQQRQRPWQALRCHLPGQLTGQAAEGAPDTGQ